MPWHVRAVPLPDRDSPEDYWIDRAGCLVNEPLEDAESLPGRYVAHGLVDAHAHPAARAGAAGPVALDAAGAVATLAEWGRTGVTMVRDVGSPGGVTLTLDLPPGSPRLQAAGRFLAPQDQYFPTLLPQPTAEEQLTQIALAEIARGAVWLKVIADFPRVSDGMPSGPAQPTYSLPAIAELVATAHAAGIRVAAHSTIDNVFDLVEAGVDSIEHGIGIDESALQRMAQTGAAWTPTLCAVLGPPDDDVDPSRREERAAFQERLRDLLPLAVSLGVPVLAGSDAVGTIAREVMLLAAHGLSPSEALAAATTTAFHFLGVALDRPGEPASLVTYDADPREDPAILSAPRAVLIDGVRVR
jgi:imidazolonepropionase-like amidohydrolase